MAGMFYSLEEVAEKLGKSPEEIQELVKNGKLREFRDGQTQLFKVQEVDSLARDSGAEASSQEKEPEQADEGSEESAIELELEDQESEEEQEEPSEEKPKKEKSEAPSEEEEDVEDMLLESEEDEESEDTAQLSGSATDEIFLDDSSSLEEEGESGSATDEILLEEKTEEEKAEEKEDKTEEKEEEEIDLSGQTETDYLLADDTTASKSPAQTGGETFMLDEEETEEAGKAEEPSLEDIEEDVNLDSFGSGSGLLDLSLQADDTSLGGILDEIYTPEGEEGQEQAPAEGDLAIGSGAASALGEEGMPAEEEPAAPSAPTAMPASVEPAPDALSNALGIMLFAPFLAVVYSTIVIMASFSGTTPSVLSPVRTLPMPVFVIMGVLVVMALILFAITYMVNNPSTGKAKKPKAKKAKPKKEKKEKGKSKKKAKKKK